MESSGRLRTILEIPETDAESDLDSLAGDSSHVSGRQ
jgi:hypothetical protein